MQTIIWTRGEDGKIEVLERGGDRVELLPDGIENAVIVRTFVDGNVLEIRKFRGACPDDLAAARSYAESMMESIRER